jgi:hypothetical protein
MLLALTIAAIVFLGYELAVRAFREQIWAAALCIASSIWIATVWSAALLHRLDRPAMIVKTLLLLAAAIVLFARRRRATVDLDSRYLLFFIPLIAWVAFLLWRTHLTSPLTHDALAYHLPRAVLWMREHGFAYLALPIDPRLRLLPANYELLLADAMLLDGADTFTEWIAVFFFAAFVITCGALAQRWWNDTRAALATMLLAAATPVLLLHAGADKNDVMTGFFMTSALLWGGRWVGARDWPSLVLCVVATAAAIGTKPQGIFLAAALAPFVVWRLRGAKRFATIAIIGIVALALLGGALYVSRFLNEPANEQQQFVAYDDWSNVWKAPWTLLAAPFSPSAFELWVPWSPKPWFYQRDELFFSNLGAPFVICLLLVPVALFVFRRDLPERAVERHTMSIAAAAVFLLMLPVRDVPMPHGVYVMALPRYVLFLVPVVLALSFTPAIRRATRYATVTATVLIIWFTWSAVFAVLNDRFIPLNFLSWAMNHRGTRLVAFDFHRAAVVADAAAGENDVIAMDAGYGAWIHPAFGARLTRPVRFLKPGEAMPDDAKWVVIDRAWHMIWAGPGFRDVSQWRTHLGYGQPTAEDVRLYEQLTRDPRFEAVFYKRATNQAVFRRR